MAEIYGFAINVEGNAVKSITAIDQSLNHLANKANQSDAMFKGMFKFEMFKQAAGFIINAGKSVIEFGMQTEQTRIAFDVMLGSVDKGRDMFESLKQWADVTPFDNDSAYQAGRLLLNYGVAAKDIIPYMNMLGDASGGVKERFDRMAYAFGQIKAAGKLQGQDLRQLIDAGFNPLQEISVMTGQSMTVLKDKMEKGGISFEMVVQAFKHATEEGGRFAGMMDKQSQTVGGLFSTLQGNAQTAMYGLFQRMAPALKDIAKGGIEVAQSFSEWITPKQSEILAGQRAEMMAMIEVLKNGNLPLDQRRELIGRLNSEYKDYLPAIITEKTTTQELAIMQDTSNKKLLEKIKITAQQEILQDYFKKAAQAQKEAMEAQILYEKVKSGDQSGWERFKLALGKAGTGGGSSALATGGSNTISDVQVAEVRMSRAMQSAQDAQKELEKQLSLMPDMKGMTDDLVTKGNKAVQDKAMAKLKAQSDGLLKGSVSGNMDALKTSALAQSNLAPSGGLGQAKTINMNFNQPLMQINAQSIDGQDMQNDAELVINQIARELHNIAYEQGVM